MPLASRQAGGENVVGAEIWLPALMMLVGAVGGYFGKRIFEKTGRNEELDRAQKLLSIRAEMQGQGIAPEDLASFEDQILNRRPRVRAIEDTVELELKPHSFSSDLTVRYDIEPDMTQADMNAAAFKALEKARAILDATLKDARKELSANDAAQLEAVQSHWEQYSSKRSSSLA
jgi:hypothetical protein